jgi:membrane protein DedA with SNARE-associated domain
LQIRDSNKLISSADIKTLLENYGYPAIVLGTIVEGETVLILAGMLSFWGVLDLPLVMIMAFIGSYGGDQFMFFLGRHKGQRILIRHPKWRSRLERIHRLLKSYHTAIILGFRFMYGFRLVTPLVLGMDREIKAGRFALLNGISAIIWSILVAGGGYFLGEAIEPVLKDSKNFQFVIVAGFSLIVLLALVLKNLRSKTAHR